MTCRTATRLGRASIPAKRQPAKFGLCELRRLLRSFRSIILNYSRHNPFMAEFSFVKYEGLACAST
jgi:hypothetical protein